jgi:hypothetical protein
MHIVGSIFIFNISKGQDRELTTEGTETTEKSSACGGKVFLLIDAIFLIILFQTFRLTLEHSAPKPRHPAPATCLLVRGLSGQPAGASPSDQLAIIVIFVKYKIRIYSKNYDSGQNVMQAVSTNNLDKFARHTSQAARTGLVEGPRHLGTTGEKSRRPWRTGLR